MIELTRELLAKLPMWLRIEIEENAQRKDLSQSELAAVQELLIKELSKHKAPGTRTDLKPTSARKQAEVRATTLIGKLFNEGTTRSKNAWLLPRPRKLSRENSASSRRTWIGPAASMARSRGLKSCARLPGSTFAT